MLSSIAISILSRVAKLSSVTTYCYLNYQRPNIFRRFYICRWKVT